MNIKPLVNKIGLALIRFGKKKFQIKDAAKAERRGMFLSRLVYFLDKKHRKQTFSNLAVAFPEKTEAERNEIGRAMYRHIGCITADFIRSGMLSETELDMPAEGTEHLTRLVAEKKGVLLVTGHLGNWERLGGWLPRFGIRASGVARDANDDELTQEVKRIRGNRGLEILSSGSAARDMLTRLKAGEIIAILPDQNNDDAYIPFFGRIAGTALGPARLSIKTGAPILPMCILRTGPGQFRVVIREPLVAREGEDATQLMTRVNEELETMIRLAPEQYLWMHDRWRNARRKGLF